MKRFARAALLLALFLVTAKSTPAQEKDKVPQTPFCPLAVDTTWNYKAGANRFQIRVAKHEKIGGVMCARLEMLTEKKVMAFEHLGLLSDKNGDFLARYTFEGREMKPPVPLLRLPPKKGDKWAVKSEVGDKQTIEGEFVVGEEEITVLTNKYKTTTITGQNLKVNGVALGCTYFFAEGVGMVKQVLEMEKVKIVIELESHTPGKN